ncbi:hypothetical protein [Metabacillus malikii]|uniref:Uncharacterized protein n=1 Tax=Metabacillus malikii TaxID=1504265 RepID=A0ABT9ZAK5_9BACI|nr:hypothetical protein [Metabacillus malikii]MDQ0229272.1 hypothetical protein [Metabacillus malikii]
MKVVDKLKNFIVEQDVLPKAIHINPKALQEIENEKFVYVLPDTKGTPVKRFMGIELIASSDVKEFKTIEQEGKGERWIVKQEVKKIKERCMKLKLDGEIVKDVSLLLSYISYLERELEDKTNYLSYLRTNAVEQRQDGL